MVVVIAILPSHCQSCPGLTGASSTPRLLGLSTSASGILDRPIKSGDDTECQVTISPDLGHRGKNAGDVLRAREAVIAVLDHGQYDVVGWQAMGQRERVLPGHV